MPKTYGVFCTKGGVGKSTTAANLGAILADMHQKVLLIDGDPQQSLSRWYPLSKTAPFGLTQLYKSASAEGCISSTVIDGLDIVLNDDPSKDPAIATFLRESFYNSFNLKKAIEHLGDQYDYVIIDTQGSKGIIQETVLIASDVVLSPVQPNGLDAREFINGTLASYNQLIPKPGYPNMTGRVAPPPLRVLINMADRTTMTEGVVKQLRKRFDAEADHHITVLNTQIPDLKSYKEAFSAQSPVHRYERHRGGPTLSALQIMKKLVHELEPKLIDVSPSWKK